MPCAPEDDLPHGLGGEATPAACFGTGEVSAVVSAFGIGLGLGNAAIGRLSRLCGRDEVTLVLATVLLTIAVATFMLMPLPLIGALACLVAWGAALGLAAPSSTAILAT